MTSFLAFQNEKLLMVIKGKQGVHSVMTLLVFNVKSVQ